MEESNKSGYIKNISQFSSAQSLHSAWLKVKKMNK